MVNSNNSFEWKQVNRVLLINHRSLIYLIIMLIYQQYYELHLHNLKVNT